MGCLLTSTAVFSERLAQWLQPAIGQHSLLIPWSGLETNGSENHMEAYPKKAILMGN
jgi:hypothetical protein